LETTLNCILVLLLIATAILDWPVAIILVRTSLRAPSVRALRERALLAVVIAVVTNVFLLTVFNTEAGRILWSNDTGREIVRLLIVGLGLVPQAYWLLLFVTGGFSDK
jgi:hypothetical protein